MRADRKGKGEAKAIAGDPAEMRLFVRALKLTDFRNYARAELKLDARPVVLIGDNGSGKTNLLEAVSLLGPGQGLRGRPYSELCRKEGAGGFAVAAEVVSRQDEVEIGTGLAAGSREESESRTVRIAGKDESAGALSEHVKLVWLIPAMDGLFTGPASERRRFLDRLVLAVDPKMRTPLGRYDRAMRQRNRLFQMREGSRALFEGLEEQMAEAGTAIAAMPSRWKQVAPCRMRGGATRPISSWLQIPPAVKPPTDSSTRRPNSRGANPSLSCRMKGVPAIMPKLIANENPMVST